MRGQENSGFNVVDTKDDQLTTTRLSSVPKRNMNEFLLTYVQNQRHFLKHYLSNEMTTTAPNHQEQESTIRSPAKSKSQANVFGTPVLRARVPIEDNVVTKQQFKALSVNSKEKSLPSAHGGKKTEQNLAWNTTTKKRDISVNLNENTIKNSKKRAHTETDNEETQRWEERRKRKKSKKIIMQTSGQEKSTSPSKQKSPKKVPTGFALMHGFCATNVGKNRLTLDPMARDVGFFKKGKASGAASTGGRKLKITEIQFSEVKFLKSNKRKREPSDTSSHAYSSFAGGSAKKRVLVTHNSSPNGSCKDNESQSTPRNSSTTISAVKQYATEQVARIRLPYNPADSVVWDIEADVKLSLQGADSEGSITVKMPRNLETMPVNVNDEKPVHSALSVGSSPSLPMSQCSSLSLGPSKSASQVAPAIIRSVSATKPIETGSTSKYFNYWDTPGELLLKDNLGFAEEERAPTLSDDLQSFGHGPYQPRELVMLAHSVTDLACREECISRNLVGTGLVSALDHQDIDAIDPAVSTSETGNTVIAGEWLPLEACNSDELGSLYDDFHDQFYEARHYQDLEYSDCGLLNAGVTESCGVGLDNNYDDLHLSSFSDNDIHHQSAPDDNDGLMSIQSDDTMLLGNDCDHTSLLDQCNQDISYSNPGVLFEHEYTQGIGLYPSEHMLDSGRCDFDLDSDVSDSGEECRHVREFCQGRHLLLFGSNSSLGVTPGITRLRDVEVEVAVGLKTKHWLPQRLGV